MSEHNECVSNLGLEEDDVDTVSHATDWAHAFSSIDKGSHERSAPPLIAPPGEAREPAQGCSENRGDVSHGNTHLEGELEVDCVTGATPGVASACRDLGMSQVDDVVRQRGIKPPGEL